MFFQPCEAMRQVRLRLAACGLSQGGETASQLPGDECDTSSSRHVSACGSHFLFTVVILLLLPEIDYIIFPLCIEQKSASLMDEKQEGDDRPFTHHHECLLVKQVKYHRWNIIYEHPRFPVQTYCILLIYSYLFTMQRVKWILIVWLHTFFLRLHGGILSTYEKRLFIISVKQSRSELVPDVHIWKCKQSVRFELSEVKGHCSVMSHKHDLSFEDFLQ